MSLSTQHGHDLKAKKTLLIEILKKRYKKHYDAIQPIPYIKDRLYSVDKVFVEGGTEFFIVKGATQKEGTWIRVESYKDIFKDSRVKAKRRIIEAEAGYGKSTVTLQLAYDWCNGVKDSPLRDVEILILLKLRQLGGVESIYKAIKMFLVPLEPRIKSTDIKSIIEGCSSVEILLDGYDEYPDRNRGTGSDVGRIIKMTMFEKFDVALTTRYLPKDYDESNTKRVRLVGFDDKARDQYIRKAVTGEDEKSVAKVKRALKDNPILDDMCQVPLFFVMFAHMTHEKEHFQNFKSVTGFFRYMIKCFHTHLRNKTLDKNTKAYILQYELKHNELDKVAFEGLSKETQQLAWGKDELVKRLGKAFYNHYIAVGILVEEEVFDEINGKTKIEVRFYHKLFCEWYACFRLVDIVLTRDATQMKNILDNIDPFDLQYLYRFSCGINPRAGNKIIEYLKSRNECDKFAILCIMEQTDKVDDMKKTIRDICSEDVKIDDDDSKLLQRSTIQLLEIAAKYDIPISCVTLNQSFEQVDKEGIKLRSGQTLPKLLTVEKIHIETDEEKLKQRLVPIGVVTKKERELSEDEVMKICAYALGSKRLNEISFGRCLLPLSLSRTVQSAEIINRNIKVTWRRYGYCFNFQSGLWEVDDVNVIRRLCSSRVDIRNSHSELLQRCTIQLVENASNNDIPISCVTLDQSFEKVDKGEIKLRSGQTLPKLLTVEKIHIKTEEERELSVDDFMKICVYALGSKRLKEISFGDCLWPILLTGRVHGAEFITRNIKVIWCRYGYRFNFGSGLWEVDDVSTVRRLCSSQVEIWNTDSELLQRCTIQLLKNASNNDIPISSVCLWDCSPRVSESGLTPQSGLTSQSGLILQSGLSLSILSSLQLLVIHDLGRRLTSEEFVAILAYSSQCTRLKELRFSYYYQIKSVPVESIPSLKSRQVKVWIYRYDEMLNVIYQRLNLTTGQWQNCDFYGNLPGEEGFDRLTWRSDQTDEKEDC